MGRRLEATVALELYIASDLCSWEEAAWVAVRCEEALFMIFVVLARRIVSVSDHLCAKAGSCIAERLTYS